jgi:Fe-S cluster biosynthesis and repair protein YggX
MADVQCSRCGSTAAALTATPLPGQLGQTVLTQTCAACWQEWVAAQVILMNEKRLTPGDPEHYAILVREMRTFLSLQET